ncbi:Maf family nucleotide pyrophosphatase [Sporosalibacterium faouarense]|uniref:Maf family nucleotide pyrophosphatase n=1 Tax=Sporosalibacterium faouarense TaxID=516123 RepID=UPI00141D43B0|nr:septum formation protein Maf [Bacillota bacterium]
MKKLILASSSPRRKDLMSRFNIDIEVSSSNIEEKIRENEIPEQIVMSLAFQKAQDVADRYNNNEIILAADTIVYKDKVLGKPDNEEEAMDMLMSLNGKEHLVLTGICLIQVGTLKKVVSYSKTRVKFRNLSQEKLKRYLSTGEYKDKAGSYGIQGYGSILVDWIEGSYSNIVGLPISKVDYLLEKYFDFPLL